MDGISEQEMPVWGGSTYNRDSKWKRNVGAGIAMSDAALATLRAKGWEPTQEADFYRQIAMGGFSSKVLPKLIAAAEFLAVGQPMTIRGLMYEMLSAGWFATAREKYCNWLSKKFTTLRHRGIIPSEWLTDSNRYTSKPASWLNVGEFGRDVGRQYRKDRWAEMRVHVCCLIEKDARAAVLRPIIQKYDIALHVIRGNSSGSFANELAQEWAGITKPIVAYYFGDWDPRGLQIEQDIKRKLADYSQTTFTWTRLGVLKSDFETLGLHVLKPKPTDRCTPAFLKAGLQDCAEVDAIPAPELRRRLEDAITPHIDQTEWDRLGYIETLERELVARTFSILTAADAFAAGMGED